MIWKILIVILIIVAIALGVTYYYGNKLQKKQREQQGHMDAIAQTVSMLVIDKKRLKITESGLPQMVIDQTPRHMRWSKIPVKKECKVVVSGIYISAIKSARGGLEQPAPKKKGLLARFKKS